MPMPMAFRESELQEQTFAAHVELFQNLSSTQDRALELCSDASLMLPALVVAEQQTAGRGRDGASWWSPEGALLFSLIVPLWGELAQPNQSGDLSMAIAQATADYLRETLQPDGLDQAVRVKRPNDVYVADAKIAGLLIDVPHQPIRDRRLAILGVGLNVNNDCSNCPEEITVPAVSVSQLTGRRHDLQASLVSLLGHIESQLM